MNLSENETEITSSSVFVTPSEKQLKSLIPSGSIIFPKRGGAIATNKKRYVKKDIFADSNVMAILPIHSIFLEFAMLWLSSFDLATLNTGTSVPQINNKDIEPLVFPLPPVEEQHRIVTKVNELMSLCDQLEQETETSLAAHTTLVENLLAILTSSKDAHELTENWHRIADHFTTLFTTEESIDQLKQTVLQLAVMGKLSQPSEYDSPVSELLADVLKLQKEKATKKEFLLIESEYKNLNASIDEKRNRVLTKARVFCDFITKGTTPAKPELVENGEVPFLKVYNIVNNQLDFHYRPVFVSNETHSTKLKRSRLTSGDVIMNIVGPPLGKVAIINDDYPEWNMNQALAVFRPLGGIYNKYIYYMLTTDQVLGSVLKEVKGTAGQDNLSLEQCRDLLIPLPSVEEQHRIVDKIDQLSLICDQLKTHLQQAQQTRLHLADAMIEKALS